MSKWTQLRVLLLFACGYFVSYVFRGVNLGFAPYLSRDLGLSSAGLGVLTSLYFLAFAATQIPAGVLLDHYSPRRVIPALLVVTGLGSFLFGHAQALSGLMLGRLLIGVGVAACLAGAFKALAMVFPIERLPMVNGLVMAVGGLGGVVVGSPLTWLLGISDWRTICYGLTGLSLTVAFAIWCGAPAAPKPHQHGGVLAQFKGTGQILASGTFWRVASLSAVTQGVFYAMQSLWVGPYLSDVSQLSARDAGSMVSILGLAMMGGCVGFGAIARHIERIGMRLHTFCGVGMVAFIVTQLLIMVQAPLPRALLWAAYGAFGSIGILTYALMAEYFPQHLLGRVSTTLTLVMFVLVFAFQTGVGALLNHWLPVNGHHPAIAHLSAWSILLVLQVACAIWYFYPAAKAQPSSCGSPSASSPR
jgi:predicted MFS family arabinose efflux permease